MILQIFSVKDKKLDAFLQPFFSPNLATAMRSLTEVLNDPDHSFAKHVDDYILYSLGSFDDATGQIHSNTDGADSVVPLSQLKKAG